MTQPTDGRPVLLRGGTVALAGWWSGSHVGDRVQMWLGDGTPVTLQVAAIYRRGLGFGDVTLAKATVAGHLPRAGDDEVLVRTGPGGDASLAAWTAGHPGSTVLAAGARTRSKVEV